MKCANCSSLSFMFSSRKCRKCSVDIYTNINVLCSRCSDKDKVCEVCLKNIKPALIINKGCNCGK